MILFVAAALMKWAPNLFHRNAEFLRQLRDHTQRAGVAAAE